MCVCVYVYESVSPCLYVRSCPCECVYACTRASVCMCVCSSVRFYVRLFISARSVCLSLSIYIYIQIIRVHAHALICVEEIRAEACSFACARAYAVQGDTARAMNTPL